MSLELRYFAWLRERVGAASERIDTGAETVGALVEELRAREERYLRAFVDMRAVRVAVDQEMADLDASIEGAREVAFFPPMTGG